MISECSTLGLNDIDLITPPDLDPVSGMCDLHGVNRGCNDDDDIVIIEVDHGRFTQLLNNILKSIDSECTLSNPAALIYRHYFVIN